MPHRASSNNSGKNVNNINPPDGNPSTNILGTNSLTSLTECKTAGPHYQGADGEGPLLCDYPDSDEDSPTSSLENSQKNSYNDRERQAHKKKGLGTLYNDNDSANSDELERNGDENLPGRTGPDQNLLKENRPVGEMSDLVNEDIEEKVNSLLDQKTPEGGDWEPTDECMQRNLDIVSKRLREWKKSRKVKRRT